MTRRIVATFLERIAVLAFGVSLVGLITFSSPQTKKFWFLATGFSFLAYILAAIAKRSVKNADNAILFHNELDGDE